MAKNPLDDMVDDLVVFKHEDPSHPERYFSNHPLWGDSRVRDHWMKRHGPGEGTDPETPDEEAEVEDYSTWTNDDLRTELASRGLSVDGKKADLVKRLEDDDASSEQE